MDNNLKAIINSLPQDTPEIKVIVLKSAVHSTRKTVLRGRRSCN